MDDRLRKIQLRELDILKEFVRICNKHDLHYFLAGGTLLGAVRHKGFIPWDDDIDVAMLREDYDRFAQLAPLELDKRYFYQSPDTDPYYFLTYNKIRENGTEIYEERFKDAKFHKGIFIDIFPLDFCPTPGPICHLLFNVLAVMNYRGQVDSGEGYEPYREISGKIGYAVLRLFSPRHLVHVRKWLLNLSQRLSRGEYVASYAGAYGYHREISSWSWFQAQINVEFEGQKFLGPQGFDHIMSQSYGRDYMEFPAAEKQVWHIDLTRSKL